MFTWYKTIRIGVEPTRVICLKVVSMLVSILPHFGPSPKIQAYLSNNQTPTKVGSEIIFFLHLGEGKWNYSGF